MKNEQLHEKISRSFDLLGNETFLALFKAKSDLTDEEVQIARKVHFEIAKDLLWDNGVIEQFERESMFKRVRGKSEGV